MSEAASIVVGGGLAGSAFAIELARHGRPVIVLERTPGAHHKVCGEFLSAEAQALLELAARAGAQVIRGARIVEHAAVDDRELPQALVEFVETDGRRVHQLGRAAATGKIHGCHGRAFWQVKATYLRRAATATKTRTTSISASAPCPDST